LLVQDRVNEHLLLCKKPMMHEPRPVMSQQNELSPHSQLEPQYGLHGMVPTAMDGSTTPTAADRLYQLAALTAGIFLLVTLL
jgi:hypothetical protein